MFVSRICSHHSCVSPLTSSAATRTGASLRNCCRRFPLARDLAYVAVSNAAAPFAIHSPFEAACPVNLHCAANMRTCIAPRTSNRGHGIAIFRSAASAPRNRAVALLPCGAIQRAMLAAVTCDALVLIRRRRAVILAAGKDARATLKLPLAHYRCFRAHDPKGQNETAQDNALGHKANCPSLKDEPQSK